jgi:hypothetical protein
LERESDEIRVKLKRRVSYCLIFATFKLKSDRNSGIFAGVTRCGNEKPKSRRFTEIYGDLRRFTEIYGEIRGPWDLQGDLREIIHP